MSESVERQHLDSLLPPGPIWEPAEGGDLDNFIEAWSENIADVREFALSLQYARDPHRTPYLSDLEREFGIRPATNQSKTERREYLATVMYRRDRSGDIDRMRNALAQAGFSQVQVHANDPAVDPAPFVDEDFQLQCGGDNAYAGRDDAYCGQRGGDLLVNGALFRNRPAYYGCDHEEMFCGNDDISAGYFERLEQVPIEYEVPEGSAAWPLIFFVSGDKTVDSDDSILELDRVRVSAARRAVFLRIILRFKPLHSWAVLRVEFN